MSIIHAHVDMSSRDCDGRYTRMYTSVADEGQTAEEYRAHMVDIYGDTEGTVLTDTPERFEHTKPTEEGYSHVDIEFCDDEDCVDRPGTFRDHTAEAAGY